ncbi:MAG TPA: S-methyl-5-thioribose-1-phosphate isomerase, partial [Thermoplasmata archaeon]|nr:S-methyl-5-thioribose-1-phosphate isomerase [Thermoplasmata archaeon]
FYVAAPWSTFDGSRPSGRSIPVEERGAEEVLAWAGRSTAPIGSAARNPAFDVTPARFVTAFVTPDGLVRPSELAARLPRTRRPE